MKKITVLALIFVLLCAGVAYGGSEMIGKTVQGTFPVTVNGTQLSTEAIVIDGVSYLPTKAVAESLGATVEFKDNTISVSSAKEASITSTDSASTNTESATTTEPLWRQEYKIESNGLLDDAGLMFNIKDDKLYVPASEIKDYVDYDRESKKITFKVHDKNVTALISSEYVAGAEAYTENGWTYVDTSLFGWTYTINADTKIITVTDPNAKVSEPVVP